MNETTKNNLNKFGKQRVRTRKIVSKNKSTLKPHQDANFTLRPSNAACALTERARKFRHRLPALTLPLPTARPFKMRSRNRIGCRSRWKQLKDDFLTRAGKLTFS